ncbi:hydroxypyruvate reductase [Halogranum rubrum]|uniref:Hydroxypyruvate reductase n=1 Tax=Halogranum rubrum TaxID=553466 RepID=A0A1I4JQL3_9EURY|nr:DUF4147 domain-containing protein [Halogranum rubrum]SFL68849.1 hydroxypyruvate reductase [Halogranum rubrum]
MFDRPRLATTQPRATACSCLEAALEAANPLSALNQTVRYESGTLSILDTSFDVDSFDRVVVAGGGNAAGVLSKGLEELLSDRIDDGIVVTDVPTSLSTIQVFEGDHPVPTARNVEATEELLKLLDEVSEDTLVLCPITGGASALLTAPAPSVTLEDLQMVTESLLSSGASIVEINVVRKHLSRIKGGQLATRAMPATVVGVVVSDVVGNDLSAIASGPTVPDSSTFAEAQRVVDSYGISVSDRVQERLEAGIAGTVDETPTASSTRFDSVSNHVIGDVESALLAAEAEARNRGYHPMILSTRIRGEAREAAKTHLAIAEEIRSTQRPIEPPAVLISGGETTVTLSGDGVGGPNQEFALSAAIELEEDGVVVASADSDGIDGVTDAAGAIVDDTSVDDPIAARDALLRNDAYPALKQVDALLKTGQTGTNVNDIRIVVVEGPTGP